ncbi:MAG: hypothetical protein HYW63_00220 [Candidatus Levybacteria bacterium]|nr:hypothetical protein [Candidatus Levybacteria bacterium]
MKPKISEKDKKRIIKEFGHYPPTKEELFQKIMESQKRMNEALAGAWGSAPNEKAKKELLKVGEKAAKLQSGIKKAFGKKK